MAQVLLKKTGGQVPGRIAAAGFEGPRDRRGLQGIIGDRARGEPVDPTSPHLHDRQRRGGKTLQGRTHRVPHREPQQQTGCARFFQYKDHQ